MKKDLLKIALVLKLTLASVALTSYVAEAKTYTAETQQQEEIASRTLWGLNLSPFAREVFVTLKEKGVKFNHEKIPPKKLIDATGGQTPENFLKISEEGKIPAYEETTVSGKHMGMVESLDIMNYIENTTKGKSLRAKTDKGNELVTEMMNYANNTIASVTQAGLLMQKVILPKFFKQATDEGVVKEKLAELPAIFDKLEKDLSDNRSWIAKTSDISLADIAIVSHLATVNHVGMDLIKEINPKKRPHLAKYVTKVLNRPSFKEAMAEAKESLKPAANKAAA